MGMLLFLRLFLKSYLTVKIKATRKHARSTLQAQDSRLYYGSIIRYYIEIFVLLAAGIHYLVSGIWYLVSGIWYLGSGIWYLVSGVKMHETCELQIHSTKSYIC